MTTSNKPEYSDLLDIAQRYLKYWKWIIACGTILGVLAFVYFSLIDRVYEITANTIIKEDTSGGPGAQLSASMSKNSPFGAMLGGRDNSVEDEAWIMGSYSNMKNMAYDLKLYQRYDLKMFPFNKNLYKNSPLILDVDKSILDTLASGLLFKIKVGKDINVELQVKNKSLANVSLTSLPGKIETPYGDFLLKKSDVEWTKDSYDIDITVFSLSATAEQLLKQINIKAINRKSNIVILNVEDTRPQRGIDMLNYVIKNYNDNALEENHRIARNTVVFIEDRVKSIALEVDSLEKVIASFKKANKMVDVGAMASAFAGQYWTGKERELQFDVQSSLLDMLETYVDDPNNKYSLIPLAAQIPEVASKVVMEFNSAILERERMLKNSNESNPSIQLLDGRIKSLRENIKSTVKTMRNDYTIQRKSWQSHLATITSKMNEMPDKELEYVEIERLRQVKTSLYVFLLTKKEETQLLLASGSSKAEVIDNAYCKLVPVGPRKSLNSAIAFLVGLILALFVIYLKITLRRKVSSKEELEILTRLPILGEVCQAKENDRLVVKDGVDSSIAELFRLIRTNLQFVLKKDKKVILVTSSVSGEGKSFFSLNLAVSFSLIKNKKVVLVGLDIRNPKLADYLSIKNNKGMTSYLAMDDIKCDDIIINQTNIHPNFHIIPAGPIPPNPSELLLSDRLESLFDYLRAHFDYIIVDTAPIGMVSDTYSLDRISDVTLAVFRADYTDKSNLKTLENAVDLNSLKNLNVVLNGTSTKASYGYGYAKKD